MSPREPGVFVFPGAGSFGGELRPLVGELAPGAWVVRYPGRFGKDFGSTAGSFDDTVEACVGQVRRRPNRPVLVGHSFGAYVAYAAAARLEQLGTRVSALAVAGATAPSLLTVPEAATRSRTDAETYLESIDPGLLSKQSGEWRDVVLDTLAHDLRQLGEFTASEFPEVRCPVFTACGTADPLASADGMGGWAAVTAAGCAHRDFPGGHSDLLHSPEFAVWLREVRDR
ncbi:thioesterase II family protein [Streptomyces barkulensis]|uniref:thioesterase II family protein n=1 Tax=Streptomyces barkulensis TaxID=1257026 RepID=UPI00130449D6|nr:alpha/beta fold hydrolase [Streptomyces barkulensis]